MTAGDEPDDPEILGDDMEIRDEPRAAEEDAGDLVEVSEGDTEPRRDQDNR